MDKTMVHRVTSALRDLFDDEEVPAEFTYHGQTFEQRCEAWALHALDQLAEEIEAF